MKTVTNIVYDGHAQQKLVTPHIRDRCVSCKLCILTNNNIKNSEFNNESEISN